MLDIGWPELMIILVVAVIVIGPKDLPKTMYTVGKWVRAARRMTGQMQRQFDDAMRDAELDDIRDGLKKASPTSIKKQIEKTIDPTGTLGKAVDIGSGRSVKQYLKEGLSDTKDQAAKTDDKDTQLADDEGADKVDVAGVQDDKPAVKPVKAKAKPAKVATKKAAAKDDGENVTPKLDKKIAQSKRPEPVSNADSERS